MNFVYLCDFRDTLQSEDWKNPFYKFNLESRFTTDLTLMLHRGIDLRLKAFPKWLERRKVERLKKDQRLVLSINFEN